MSVQIIKGKYLIFKSDKTSEVKFRKELSKLIIDTFGKKDYTIGETTKIISFSLDYFVEKFREICLNETSVRFYQNIFKFHEHSVEIVYNFSDERNNQDSEIDFNYIAKYRRVLKYILEMGCEVKMHNQEASTKALKTRIENKLNDLLFLGEMILTCVSLYAEQTMIEDINEIRFEDDLYVFSRKHHYDFIFQHIKQEFGGQLTKAVVDKTEYAGLADLKQALKNCFDINYDNVGHIIASIHEQNKSKGGDVVGVNWDAFPLNLSAMFGADSENAKLFFKGLTLDKSNKMPLLDLACKPYKLNRYLYKPIIIWNIEGEDYALVGKHSWSETFIQLASNAIPWGKAPEEWLKNNCFRKYVNEKEDAHDKWLDDAVEEKLIHNKIYYERNLKSIDNVDINNEEVGEIDFIIISEKLKKIFIADCKHLLGRYDTPNQRNDYNVFVSGKKPYNKTLERKVTWFKKNKQLIQNHFDKKYQSVFIDILDFEIEGIFIINTPTLYMYNSTFRIYSITQIENVVLGKHEDPTFTIFVDEADKTGILNINYPYFNKPQYNIIDPFEDTEQENP
ncbi:hypothetical protein J2X97_000678 [Epilithonimonas hungarica]|uniref:hypothetical protein n=1 Tax=Epilithonimonas hungarica TaxID=454006 RepID=UPI0027858903|nr:hypothetical protein [Epilithonimonas hungarica]MDP9955041.1 hypothetical protein [Epilithonimonas hungarica]